MSAKVGVVVVNHNQKEVLRHCLESWGKAGGYTALLVSDNASTDGALDMLKRDFPGLQVLAHPQELGFAGAANEGMKEMARDHDYVFLTTNDTEVEPGMLAELVKAMEADPGLAAAGPKILFFGERGLLWHAGGFIHRLLGKPGHYGHLQPDGPGFDRPRDCDFVSGCGFLLRSSALKEAGYFREELAFYAEDSDLCFRLRRAGWRVAYVPAARMYHRVSATLGAGSPLSAYYITRNSLALLARHRRAGLPGFLLLVLPWRLLKAHSLAFTRALLRGAWDFALGRYGMRDARSFD